MVLLKSGDYDHEKKKKTPIVCRHFSGETNAYRDRQKEADKKAAYSIW